VTTYGNIKDSVK
jgi:C1A family cysteine protease